MCSLYQVVNETLLFSLFPFPRLLRHTDSGRVLLTLLKTRPTTIHVSPLQLLGSVYFSIVKLRRDTIMEQRD